MIQVLVVEDSAVARDFLVHVLSSDPEIQVIGTAHDGEAALEFLARRKPHVITMDINMPKMNGFEVTRRIMQTSPVPIIIVSGEWDVNEVSTAFRAVEAGALAVLPRPQGLDHPDHQASAKTLVQTVKLMSEVKVIKRWARANGAWQTSPHNMSAPPAPTVKQSPADIRIVAMGASTGGPIVLNTILSGLPKNLPVPVLIVQHIAQGFVQGFVEWLAQSSGFAVKVASHDEPLVPGCAYVAPDRFHIGVAGDGRIILNHNLPENGLRPSVSYLFRSVANVYGEKAIGVLLTGMGKDGAQELKLMKQKGAITIVQDEASSIVNGMPGEGVKLDAARYVLPPDQIASLVTHLLCR
jgi:two-component system, chemotaxis family, protein-glutamate methylesterase/glutaminase